MYQKRKDGFRIITWASFTISTKSFLKQKDI